MGEPITKLEPLLTVEEAAAVVHMSPSFISAQIKMGKLKKTKLGRIVRIEPSDLREFIDACKEKPAEEFVTTLSLPATFDTEGALLKVTESRKG